jgi:hypothetical protein
MSMDSLNSNLHVIPQPSTMDPVTAEFALFSTIHRNMKFGSENAINKDKEKMFKINFGNVKSRNLLSVDEDFDSVDKQTAERNIPVNNTIEDVRHSKSNLDLINILDSNIKTNAVVNKTSNMDISDIFSMISSWFSALAASDIKKPIYNK